MIHPSTSNRDALKIWREQLEFLLVAEAKAADAKERFKLRKDIEEARSRVAGLLAEPRPRPAFNDDEAELLSRELTSLCETRRERVLAGRNTRGIDKKIREQRSKMRRGPELEAGERLHDGRFLLLKICGKGGFGRVWQAWDEERQSVVALKVLFSHHIDDRTRVDRFFRGGRWMGELIHPAIVRVYEPHLVDSLGWHFFVMEYVDGSDLEKAVLEGRISREDSLRIVIKVGEALALAHDRGIVHRDVKPSNILLDADLRPKLTDFDLVRADGPITPFTQTQAMMGTFLFAAPELLEDAKEAGPPADVYALASTAVFTLWGEQLPAHYYRMPKEIIDELDVPRSLSDALTRATLPDASERYNNGRQLIHALNRCEVLHRSQDSAAKRAAAKLLKEASFVLQSDHKPILDFLQDEDRGSHLITITGFGGFAQKDLEEGNVDRVKHDISRILSAARKAVRMFEDVDALLRIGRYEGPPQIISLDAVCRDAFDKVRSKTEGKVRFSTVVDLPNVYGYQHHLLSVFMELFENAIMFMGEQSNPEISVGRRQAGSDVIVFVRDNGAGIDSRFKRIIFDVMTRASHDSNDCGNGLAIVERIVKLHGGKIWVESKGEGYGSTFCFTLPTAERVPGELLDREAPA